MTIIIEYTEEAKTMQARVITYDADTPNIREEFYIPKFIVDLVRAGISNGTINLSALWDRTTDITKEL